MANTRAPRTVAAVAALALLSACSTAGPPPAGPPPVSAPPVSAGPVSAGPTAPGPPAPHTARPVDPARYGIPVFPPAPAPQRTAARPGGSVSYLKRIPTTQRVAFLTIDDGFIKRPEARTLIAAAHVPVTLFLTTDAVGDDVDFFRPMIAAGAVVEAHTVTHRNLRGRPYAFQRREICGSADRLGAWYGRRPTLFRPPFGNYDATTLRAAKDCRMKAAFMWTETVNKGKVRYQQGHRVRPGDIILMHFRDSFAADFVAALRAIHRAGLTPARLEDYC